MILNCKPGCLGKKATTTGSLDLESNEVVCDFCGDEIKVSSFLKSSMKAQGKIVRNNKKKPYQFDCLTCGNNVQTELKGKKILKGKDCQKDCQFNVSKYTLAAMQNFPDREEE